MGYYFRKSLNFGGFRVKLSKSGIGYSYGVKGFRISTGPRGTYHPDKVATMALEFRELAERRMKEINIAYEALKQGNAPP
jgi:hypothetical protein